MGFLFRVVTPFVESKYHEFLCLLLFMHLHKVHESGVLFACLFLFVSLYAVSFTSNEYVKSYWKLNLKVKVILPNWLPSQHLSS